MNLIKIVHHEVHKSTSGSSGSVGFRCVVDGNFSDLGFFDLDLDLVGGLFGELELLNEFNVLQNVSLSISQFLKQVGFELFELNLEVVLLGDKFLLLLSEVGSFFLHNKGKELIFQTGLCDSEVDQGTLSLDFRRVVGVRQFRVHDKLELLVERKISVSHLDVLALSLLDDGSSVNGLEHGIDRVLQVLK